MFQLVPMYVVILTMDCQKCIYINVNYFIIHIKFLFSRRRICLVNQLKKARSPAKLNPRRRTKTSLRMTQTFLLMSQQPSQRRRRRRKPQRRKAYLKMMMVSARVQNNFTPLNCAFIKICGFSGKAVTNYRLSFD